MKPRREDQLAFGIVAPEAVQACWKETWAMRHSQESELDW
jgi:hypothetical protein